MTATAPVAKSEDFSRSKAGLKGHDDFQRTWSPGDALESEVCEK